MCFRVYTPRPSFDNRLLQFIALLGVLRSAVRLQMVRSQYCALPHGVNISHAHILVLFSLYLYYYCEETDGLIGS